ncbi:hypothetical protein BH24ACT22_BH24ACT22_12940 [soil metagenome]
MIVGFLVLVLAVGWKVYGSATTGTGALTLPQPAPNVGENAKEFTADTLDGGRFNVTDKGIYVLTFWSTLNQESYEAKASFSELAERYSDEGVSFGAVYVSNTPDKYGDATYSVMRDSTGRLTSLYNVKRVPRLFVVRDGEVAFVYNNYNEENEEFLKEKLKELVSEDSG